MGSDLGPLALFIGLTRDLYSFINVSLIAFRGKCQDFFIGRVYGFENLTRFGGHPFSANKQLLGFSEKRQSRIRNNTLSRSFH